MVRFFEATTVDYETGQELQHVFDVETIPQELAEVAHLIRKLTPGRKIELFRGYFRAVIRPVVGA